MWFLLQCRNLMPRTLDGQLTMEKTPSYFITKEAPRRVYTMSRHTKLIVVVRDPVTRAVSDYTQTLTKSPGLQSFQNLVFQNASTGLIDTSWSAVRIGIYAKHLENWLRFFPLSRFLFVSGERLVTDPAGEMGRVQDFLGLKRVVTDKHFYFNQTKGFPCLKKPEGSSRPRCLGKSKGRPHPQIPSEVLLRLRDFYTPFNLKFYQMTGQDFGWDWKTTHQSSHREKKMTQNVKAKYAFRNTASICCCCCNSIKSTPPRSILSPDFNASCTGRAWKSTTSQFKITPGNVLERLKIRLQMTRNWQIQNTAKVFTDVQ